MSVESERNPDPLREDIPIVTINASKTCLKRELRSAKNGIFRSDRSLLDESSNSVDETSLEQSPSFTFADEHQKLAPKIRYERAAVYCQDLNIIGKVNRNSITLNAYRKVRFQKALTDADAYSLSLAVTDLELDCSDDEASASNACIGKNVEPDSYSLVKDDLVKKCSMKADVADNSSHSTGKRKKRGPKKRRSRYGLPVRTSTISSVHETTVEEESSFHRPNFINTVIMGGYEMDTWYWSPYPNECVSSGSVYICEKCLELKRSRATLQSHTVRCSATFPPGNEIFRQGDISVFEVDGEAAKIYCQHLCMLGKLFIDHKALFYDVEPFLFYVATLCDSSGFHLVGYFSKQKHSEEKHNLSCIVTLPCYQERGFGRFLIDFSFLLTRKEKILGSAEKPLSELGLIAYRSYWRTAILEFLYMKKEKDGDFCNLSINEIARATGIEHEDVLQTLNRLEMLSVDNDSIFLDINLTAVRSHWQKAKSDPRRIWIDETNLKVSFILAYILNGVWV